MQQDTVLFERTGHVAVITLNRPSALNAIDTRVWNELAAAFVADDDLWVAVLTGAGDKAFCAGAGAWAISAEIAHRNRASEDAREGPRAFAEKRASVWSGR